MELMNDPVMVATGHTYDRVCIERWLQQGNRTCPVTGMRLRHLELTPNFALRNAIQVMFQAICVSCSAVACITACCSNWPQLLQLQQIGCGSQTRWELCNAGDMQSCGAC